MAEILSLKPKTFGLHISDSSLKIIKLKKKGKFLALASWGESKIKPGIVEEGEIKNEELFVQNIKEALDKVKGEKLKTKNAIVSLPEKKAFLSVIQMPKMEEDELKLAVPFEAENHIPLPIEEVYFDFQVIPSPGENLDHLDVLIIALPKKIVDPYVSSFKKAGLSVRALETESQSIAGALMKNGVSSSPVFIVDLGSANTNFIIFSGHSLRFTSSAPISSQQLTEAISKCLNVDLRKAEFLKLKYGINEIRRYINYYQSHFNHEHLSNCEGKIKKIILCGKGANFQGLTTFFASSLKIPVELGNPWVNILAEPLKEVPELPFGESLGYTTALGLALRGMRN